MRRLVFDQSLQSSPFQNPGEYPERDVHSRSRTGFLLSNFGFLNLYNNNTFGKVPKEGRGGVCGLKDTL